MKTIIFSLKCFLPILIMTSNLTIAQNIIDITGKVKDSNNIPLAGVTIKVKNTRNVSITDFDGSYALKNVDENSILEIQSSDLGVIEEPVGRRKIIDIFFNELDSLTKQPVETRTSGSVSQSNYWLGAKIGYNFIGDTDDNFFVGSASININLLEWAIAKKESKSGDNIQLNKKFGVIGNLGNFKFDTQESGDDIKKLSQSINGVSIGLGYTRDSKRHLIFSDKADVVFRQFMRTGVRITSFENIGEDDETETLAQSATTAGLEFELSGFKNKGALTVSTGVSLYLFDKNIYNKIFEEEKNNLLALDVTIILPISEKVGFFTNGTFARGSSGAFIMGIILNP